MRRSRPALRIGLDNHAGKIGDRFVNLVELLLPPCDDLRIERIEGGEPADFFRAAHVNGQRQAHAVGPEDIGDAGDLFQILGLQQVRVCIDVVDGAAVDADGS